MRHQLLLLLLALSCALSSTTLHHAKWFAMADCVEYIVQPGDICYDIAKAHGISVEDLENWNPGLNCYNLQIGQFLCVSDPDAPSPPPPPFSPPPPFTPPPPPSAYNGKVFMEYIGALYNFVTFSNVHIDSRVDFYFIIAFAIDYSSDPLPTNGMFQIWWQNTILTAEAVKAIKAQHDNVKVMLSIGGDSVRGEPVLFNATDTTTWVENAVSSLTSLITEYNLDGIDINYEHFAEGMTKAVFAECIGKLIGELKRNKVITVATIAPFDQVEAQYVELYKQYGSEIDYVNFQFYTYANNISPSQYVSYFETAAAKYGGGSNMLASFNTKTGTGPLPDTALAACKLLQASGKLPGIFVWSADNSLIYSPTFIHEKQAQDLVALAASTSSDLRSFA